MIYNESFNYTMSYIFSSVSSSFCFLLTMVSPNNIRIVPTMTRSGVYGLMLNVRMNIFYMENNHTKQHHHMQFAKIMFLYGTV